MKIALAALLACILCVACQSRHFTPALLPEITIRDVKISQGETPESVRQKIGAPDEVLQVDVRQMVPGHFVPPAVARSKTDKVYPKWRYGTVYLVFDQGVVSQIFECPPGEKGCR